VQQWCLALCCTGQDETRWVFRDGAAVSARDHRVNAKAVRSEIRFGEPALERTSIRLSVVLVCLVGEIVE
jgi:hypothetical protein